jgi:hypothetical protein
MAKNEMKTRGERGLKEKSVQKDGNGKGSALRNVAAAAPSADALIELIEKLGVVELVAGRLRSRVEEIDLDDLLDEATAYLKRNPEVLVVSLGAATIAAAMLVWMNKRREWDGSERRYYVASSGEVALIDEEEVEVDRKRRDSSSRTSGASRPRRGSA